MGLQSGDQLGSFSISGLLGVGGMGEVYRARDTKLGREVAIKVLPEAFAKDKDRLARFGREARMLASLNHSGIAGIYELQKAGGAPFLVMELIEGQTLADRIAAGAIPIDDALALFSQIAEALESAHEQGIVHRDLKPANIKVTAEGTVKILDFGLAKAFEEETTSSPSVAPTIQSDSAGKTGEGAVLGTPAYMSPEQASGRPVDKRADIWAFGCCLYEALSGSRPFKGETPAELAADILRGEPDWTALPKTTPSRVRDLLWRCLQKDPRRRLRDIGDAWFEISESRSDSSGGFPAVAPPTIGGRLTTLQAMGIGAACLLIGAVLTWAIVVGNRDEATPLNRAVSNAPPREFPVRRSMINLGPNESFPSFTIAPLIALSSDGKDLVYVAMKDGVSQVFHRPMDRLVSTAILGTQGTRAVYISPESRWLALRHAVGIYKVPLAGGRAELLADTLPVRVGIGWDAEDSIYFGAGLNTGIGRVAVSGGTSEVITEVAENEVSHLWPTVLPGGKTLLFGTLLGPNSDVKSGGIIALDLESGRKKLVVEGALFSRYLPTGHLLFTTWPAGPRLMIVPFDPEAVELAGAPVPILPDVFINPNSRCPQLAFSSEGNLIYLPIAGSNVRKMVWIDREGHEEPLALPADAYRTPRVSPDGNHLLMSIEPRGNPDIWRYDLTRGALQKLTFHPAPDQSPTWSSDGSKIFFTSQRSGAFSIFTKAADGSGEAKQLVQKDGFWWPRDATTDGSLLLCHTLHAKSYHDVTVINLSSPGGSEILLQGPYDEKDPVVSPDGRWIAYMSDETNNHEIYVRSFPDLQGKRKISTGGGVAPLWSPEAGELFYANENKLFGVRVQTEPEFSASEPELLFEGPYHFYTDQSGGGREYDISPIDGRFLVLRIEEPNQAASAGRSMVFVENWFEEVKRIAPRRNQED